MKMLKNNKRKSLRTALSLCVLLGAAWLISRFCFQLALVQGDSMQPTYHSYELVVINKIHAGYEPGSVIAFECPGLASTLIKRVAAVPGDTVWIKDGVLYVNGAISPVFSTNSKISFAGIAAEPLLLGKEQYFVLGDNLKESKDSRYPQVALVNERDILGLVYPERPLSSD